MANGKKQGPLEGVRVVELGTHVAVPNVARAMADCGAEVIKVEGISGEEWRGIGKNYSIPYSDDENALFTAQNSNKKFVALNLKAQDGKEALLKLIAEADVFISNVRIKSLQKMGLDYESLKEKFPKLIYCHFTGFGYEGPDAARPGFDMAAFWARSGAMVDWNNEGDYPIKPVAGFGDATTSNVILSGVLMALIGREKTGKGTLVSSSLYGSALWYGASGVILTQEGYDNQFPKSRFTPSNPLSHIYQCKDGNWINITVVNYDAAHEKVLRAMGLEQYVDDSRFASFAAVSKNIREVVEILNENFLQKTRDEWAKVFEDADVVYEKLMHYSEVSKDPQAWENHYLERVSFASGAERILPRFPLQFSAYDLKPITPSRGVGAETTEVLIQMGYTETQIEKMRTEGAVK